MAKTVTLVSGRVDPLRHPGLIEEYEAGTAAGLPPGIEQTLLLRRGDEIAVMTLWATREDLETMIATGEEPFARRLIRSAGGAPEVQVFDVVAHVG